MIVALVARLATEVPVTPDADTARQWAVEELAKPAYHAGAPTLMQRLWDWIMRQLNQINEVSVGTNLWVLAIVVAVVVGIVVAALLVAGPVRRSLTTRSAAGTGLLDDDTRTAEQIRAAALAAADAGRLPEAVAEWFRALVRGLEERTVLDERPGRTADEAAAAAGERLPALAGDLSAGARMFDAVFYGRRPASPSDEAWMRALELRVRKAKPSPRLAPAAQAPTAEVTV
ncbi:MAG: DUF4129 domain-containing protein [Micrococcales bacterium]|nr:DUF4129 domain-containing protein [Micrococcales bacterium]